MSGVASHTEHAFETEIVGELTAGGGWLEGHPTEYDPTLGLYPSDTVAFIKTTQPKRWEKLVQLAGGEQQAERSLVKRVAERLDKLGTIKILRDGTDAISGVPIRLAYFEPELKVDPASVALYDANRLRVVRQVRFDPDGGDSVDVVLFVNGIPTATAELKNRWTKQDVNHAIGQYRTDRDPEFALFRRAVVHFAVDAERVAMTTRLQWGDTRFLPFNQGSAGAGRPGGKGNPGDPDGGHPTSYLWRQVWQRDAWMEILERFVFVEDPKRDPKTGKPPKGAQPTVIFPRFHQWHVVTRCAQDAREHGPGRNYLIQHSAGSGKSKEIAWLAHDLSTVYDTADQHVFSKVIVISDRTVLDDQLQKQVRAFEQTAGTVKAITQDSKQLLAALKDSGTRVVITTLQKFPYVLKQLEAGDDALKGRTYAVIVDEAHSSQTGDAARDLKRVVGAKTAADLGLEDDQEDLPAELLALVAARGQQPNLSFFAFTATPKAKTLELFGHRTTEGGTAVAFHTYSMRQAIEERFIVDVLRNYTTYEQLYRLEVKAEERIEVPVGQARVEIRRGSQFHPWAKDQKAAVIVEHYRKVVRHRLGGQAKAMVVTASRQEAVLYKSAIDRYVADRQIADVRSLVAFSGEVTVNQPGAAEHGQEFREPGMNALPDGSPLPERALPGEFDRPAYGVLIVAEKYQTGFDQPKLVAMYVDKPLKGVNAVQTLSRLNRTAPGKDETYVLDFVNSTEDIHAAFAPYFQATEATPTSPDLLFDAATKLRDAGVITPQDLDAFTEKRFGPGGQHADLSGVTQGAYDRALDRSDDAVEEFRDALDRFVRLYAFLSQVVPHLEPSIEVLHAFAVALRARLTESAEGGGTSLAGHLGMTHYRLEETGTGSIALGGEDPDPLVAFGGDGTGRTVSPDQLPMGLLGELVEFFNARFGGDLTEADAIHVSTHVVEKLVEAHPQYEVQALHNPQDDFTVGKEGDVVNAMLDVENVSKQMLRKILSDEEALSAFSALVMSGVYNHVHAQAASGEQTPSN